MNNQQNAMQEFDKEFQRQLRSAFFPADKIMTGFDCLAKHVIETSSVQDLNCDYQTYKELAQIALNGTEAWSLMNISFIINSVQSLKPQQLNVDLKGYLTLLEGTVQMAEDWNLLVSDIKVEVAKLMNKKQKPNGKNVIPIGKR